MSKPIAVEQAREEANDTPAPQKGGYGAKRRPLTSEEEEQRARLQERFKGRPRPDMSEAGIPMLDER